MDGENIMFGAAITVGLSCIVGFGLFRLIAGKGKASTEIDYGRKWSAWMVLACTVVTLPKFFRNFNAEPFATWLIGAIVYGIVAFVAGILYGKYFKKDNTKSQKNEEKRTVENSDSSKGIIHVSDREALSNSAQEKKGYTRMDKASKNHTTPTATQSVHVTIINDETFYAQAWDELNDPKKTPNKAMWAKAFSVNQGDEKKTQATYIELRVAQLKEEQALQRLQITAERERLVKEKMEEEERARVEAQKKIAEERGVAELEELAIKVQRIGGLDITGNLIEKIGGSWRKNTERGSGYGIEVALWGETHHLLNIPDFVSWVQKDVIPRVLNECEKKKTI